MNLLHICTLQKGRLKQKAIYSNMLATGDSWPLSCFIKGMNTFGHNKIILGLSCFEGRIAPRFDCSNYIEIFDLLDGKVENSRSERIATNSIFQKIEFIRLLHVDYFICGGIDHFSEAIFKNRGIKLISWVIGSTDEVILLFLSGKLKSSRNERRCRISHHGEKHRKGKRGKKNNSYKMEIDL